MKTGICCPECEAPVDLADDVMGGEIVECPECGLELEVVEEGEAYRLQLAPQEEEDWGE
jgi:alpha-aminoadipate carrier protein LysW